jgi:hypothetical protein
VVVETELTWFGWPGAGRARSFYPVDAATETTRGGLASQVPPSIGPLEMRWGQGGAVGGQMGRASQADQRMGAGGPLKGGGDGAAGSGRVGDVERCVIGRVVRGKAGFLPEARRGELLAKERLALEGTSLGAAALPNLGASLDVRCRRGSQARVGLVSENVVETATEVLMLFEKE